MFTYGLSVPQYLSTSGPGSPVTRPRPSDLVLLAGYLLQAIIKATAVTHPGLPHMVVQGPPSLSAYSN